MMGEGQGAWETGPSTPAGAPSAVRPSPVPTSSVQSVNLLEPLMLVNSTRNQTTYAFSINNYNVMTKCEHANLCIPISPP
jgi:hypothetical protein